MGGHGGLNILPQKSWHVYNQDNRERVARDEAKFEAEEKVRREKHRRAESEYRHAALLARVRGQPLDAAKPSAEALQPTAAGAAASSPVRHDIMASKRAVQQADGHFNFWREEELRAGNAEVKVDELQERLRRGKAETQTSDPRFDERFKLGHAMHGKAHTPWYAAGGSTLLAEAIKTVDGGQLLASAASREADSATPLETNGYKKHKHKAKDKRREKKQKEKGKDAALKVSSQQLKASVAAMRAEREAREAAERQREKQLLRRDFRDG